MSAKIHGLLLRHNDRSSLMIRRRMGQIDFSELCKLKAYLGETQSIYESRHSMQLFNI